MTPISSQPSSQTLSQASPQTASQPQRPIHIYLGGSFDPVHLSHIHMLQHVYDTLDADETQCTHAITASFLPTSRSPLKQHSTDPSHRFAMLEMVVNDLNQTATIQTATAQSASDQLVQPSHLPYQICEHEIWQPPPTYSIDTLSALRDKYNNASLIFIVGADSIASLAKWRDGYRLTDHVHLWVLPRDEWQATDDIYKLLPTVLQSQVTQKLSDLKSTPSGHIYIDSLIITPFASRHIRDAFATQRYAQAQSALPPCVYSYIIKNQLYQPKHKR